MRSLQTLNLLIQSLVAQGADVSIQNIHGNSPLHMMCQDKAKAADVPECISIMVYTV